MNKLSNLLRGRWVIPTAIGVTAFSGGGVLGYFAAKRRYEPYVDACNRLAKMTDEAQEKLEQKTKEFIQQTRANLPEGTFVVEVPEGIALERVVQLPPEPERKNIFEGSKEEWDEEAELSARTHARPYVITKEEFFDDDMGFKQHTITYYAGDDVLVDELDVPIYHRAQFGELRFGHGSDDKNIVYIRNETERKEWEILRTDGKYATEILGADVEAEYESQDLQHSAKPRRFLMDG